MGVAIPLGQMGWSAECTEDTDTGVSVRFKFCVFRGPAFRFFTAGRMLTKGSRKFWMQACAAMCFYSWTSYWPRAYFSRKGRMKSVFWA